jgi:hypothetical protein
MIFIIQFAIIAILIKQNLLDLDGNPYYTPYPAFIAMQVLASYLFHVETLSGAKESY